MFIQNKSGGMADLESQPLMRVKDSNGETDETRDLTSQQLLMQ